MTSLRKKPTKRGGAKLGQHLLTSRAIAAAIAREGVVKKADTILEIGPGKGMLTRELLKLGANVVAVEKDPEMVRAICDTFADEIKSGQLTIIEGDARDFLATDHSSLFTGSYSVVANIPYYITGELIRLSLTAAHQPRQVVLLIQKEVAERIARAKKESLLSLSVKVYGTPHYVKTVKAGNFNPPPKVDSAVLKICDISRKNFKEASENDFFELLHIGFGQKRKTLLGNLKKKYASEKLESAWASLNLDEKVRAEDVPLSAWLSLTQKLF